MWPGSFGFVDVYSKHMVAAEIPADPSLVEAPDEPPEAVEAEPEPANVREVEMISARRTLNALLGKGDEARASSPPPPPFNSQAYFSQPSFYELEEEKWEFPIGTDPQEQLKWLQHDIHGNQGFGKPRKSRIVDRLPLGALPRRPFQGYDGGFPRSAGRRRKKKSKSQKRPVDPNAPRKKSRFKGVYWETRDQKWRARVYCNGKRLSGGSYVNEREAALAVNRLCMQLGMSAKNPELESIKLYSEVGARSESLYGVAQGARPRGILPRRRGPGRPPSFDSRLPVKNEPGEYGGVDMLDAGNW